MLTLILAILFILASTVVITDATVIKKQITDVKNQNQEIYIGMATIIGDGTELNTTVETAAESGLIIKTESETSLINLNLTYYMECNGLTDSGVTSILVQVNGDLKGHAEAVTVNVKEDNLILENLEVTWGDVLSFEIGAVYTNGFPPFVKSDTAVGGGVISKKARIRVLPYLQLQRLNILFYKLQNIFSKNIIY